MAEKTRITPCTSCGQPRKQGGASRNGVCRLCRHQAVMAQSPEARRRGPYLKTGKPRGWALTVRTKPLPHQQHQSARKQDLAALVPPTSWWAVSSREQFTKNLAGEMGRLRLIGCTVPKSQMGVADAS